MDKDTLKALGTRLRDARIAAGFSSRDQAERELGLTSRQLEAYEQGLRVPEEPLIVRLAAGYRTHPAYLRYGDEILKLAGTKVIAAQLRTAAAVLEQIAKDLEGEPTSGDATRKDDREPALQTDEALAEARAAAPAPQSAPRRRRKPA
ncbi:MAG: helix-turn-helix domain-containing protein [Gemmatimonadaceae bacterium]|nr:helix-turn-helix domain-containing protein [Gemmatimonadaceae bacterium]